MPSIYFVVIGNAMSSSYFAAFLASTFFLSASSARFLSLNLLPIFIYFSIKFLAWENEPTNFSRSSRFRALTLF